MKKTLIVMMAIIFYAGLNGKHLISQSIKKDAQAGSLHGLTLGEWDKVNSRWSRLQPRIEVVTTSGDTIRGQLIAASATKITIYEGDTIPFKSIIKDRTVEIITDDISMIHFVKGGPMTNGIMPGLLAGGAVGVTGGLLVAGGWSYVPAIVLGITMAGAGGLIGKGIQSKRCKSTLEEDAPAETRRNYLAMLGKNALLNQKYIPDGTLDDLADASKGIRKVFPDNHLRVSTGASYGSVNRVVEDIDAMLAASSLPVYQKCYTTSVDINRFDLSWRFSDRFIAGGQFSSHHRGDYISCNYSRMDTGYHLSIYKPEINLYVEYSHWPVTRSFTKKPELLAGAGIIYANPSVKIRYIRRDPGNWRVLDHNHSSPLIGIQLRSALHYYLYPGFSVSAGVDANFLPPLSLEAYEFPASNPSGPITTPAYKLHFSTIRYKIGTSFYF